MLSKLVGAGLRPALNPVVEKNSIREKTILPVDIIPPEAGYGKVFVPQEMF